MRPFILLILPALVACAATPKSEPAQRQAPEPIPAAPEFKVVESRYEVRAYREAGDSNIRHEAHAVFRRTIVPLSAQDRQGVECRTSAPPASVAPLPASEELEAELKSQRAMTQDILVMRASIIETQKKIQAQYALMQQQASEIAKTYEKVKNDKQSTKVAPSQESPTAEAAAGTSAEKW